MRIKLMNIGELYEMAKRRAAELRCSVGRIVNAALRITLGEGRLGDDTPRFQIPTHQGKGGTVDTPHSVFDALEFQDELERLRG